MHEPIPVTVVTGFLGAGKSTLLEQWLRTLPRERTAVLINEQGEVGIDGSLLAARAARLREITGGCICCVARAALDAALLELAESSPRPTRIVVETSGAASPAGVVQALTHGSARDQLRLDGIVTVVDATAVERALQFPLAVEQLGFADVVLLSRADIAAPDALAQAQARVEPLAPNAVFAQTRHGDIITPPDTTLLDLLAQRSSVPPRIVDAQTRHGVDAVSFVHDGDLDEDRFAAWVETSLGPLEARVLRLKGILAIAGIDERVVVQGVGTAVEVTLGPPWGDTPRTSKLVLLGLDLDAAALQNAFERCRA